MQKLEWKGPPRAGKVECNEILMLGDSMLRNINVDMMKGHKLWLFAYPGITTGQLSVQIKNDIMPPPTQIGYVFVHCGTNNASTVRHNMTVTQSAKEMEHCIETLMKFYTHAKIVVSGILPRNDKENLRGQDINELVSGYCVQQKQVHYVDLSSHFDVRAKPKQFSDLFRYEQTKHLPEDSIDYVHLSDKGVQKFQDLIKDELDHVTRTKFVNTDKGIQLLTQQEWRKYRNLHRETKFHARFKICNYQPAMNDRCQPALTNETMEAYLAEQNAKRKGSHHSDHKPLPDIIPKRPKREESESPVPRKKSTENDARKTSFDGDVSRSDTGPSDQEPGKRKKQEPLSKSAIRNQMNKVKKSKRERSSRRTEREAERSDSSSPSPERSVKSDKSIHKRRRRSMTDNDRSPAHRSKRKTDRSPSIKEDSKKPKFDREPPVSPGRKISLHPSAKKKVESDKREDDKKRSRKRSNDRARSPVKRDRSRDRSESDRKRRREPTPQKSRSKDVKSEKKKESERRRSRSPRDRKSQKSSKRSKSRERSRRRSKTRSRSKDKHSIDEAARARNISQEETKKKKKKAKVSKKEESEESDGPSEKVYGIELKRRASHFSENSDKVAEGLSEYLEKDKSVEKEGEFVPTDNSFTDSCFSEVETVSPVKKEEKSSKSESDLKKRLLEKQKAKKSKSSAPANTKGTDY